MTKSLRSPVVTAQREVQTVRLKLGGKADTNCEMLNGA